MNFLSTFALFITYIPLLCVATPYRHRTRDVDLENPGNSDPAKPILPLARGKSRPEVNPFAEGLSTAPSACDGLFNPSIQC